MIRKLALVAMLASFVACKKEEPPQPTPAPEATVVPAPQPTTTPVSVPAVDLDSLPVEEDFEEEAEKDLTTANLTTKIDELEKEMSTE